MPEDRGPDGGGAPPGETGAAPAPDGRLSDASAQLLEANRRLRESAQRRDDLLSLAAEDLRGPAAALLRHVRRLQRSAATSLSEADQRALASLDRQARRVATLADGLLALKTLEGGQVQLARVPTDLVRLVGDVLDARVRAAGERGVVLSRTLPPGPLTVPADAARLAEVVGALVDSAIAFTPRGGRVRVTLEELTGGARLTVEDGRAAPSTPPRRAPRRGTPERFAGLGLGLAVCRGFAELHGGVLEVARRGSGRAAELTLPASGPMAEREAAAVQAPASGRARVLVVDDDPDARDALEMMLSDDYDVLLAADGIEAVAAAESEHPDVVLMDLYMPRMDGMAALEALRAEPLTADLPVLLISARGDELTRSRSLDLGAVDFLQKPFSGRELKARIERTLRFTRRESQLQALARTDPLTGLANVRAFRARLADEVKRARRYRTPLACVMVDMDHLKPINDVHGHRAGDMAIAAVAEVLRRELRETDFGARYGGDEFVMLLPHTSAAEAHVLAERVCARLRAAHLDLEGEPISLQASFGIAALGEEPLEDAAEALVHRADAALYVAKREGRGRVAAHPSVADDADGADADAGASP